MQLQSVVPVLRIFSVEKAREFYVDFLGFTWDWEHRFDDNAPLYMAAGRDGCVLQRRPATLAEFFDNPPIPSNGDFT